MVRNEDGEVLLAIVFLAIGASSVGHAELLAIRFGLQLIFNYNMIDVLVYCDAQDEVIKVNSPTMLENENRVLLNDAKVFM